MSTHHRFLQECHCDCHSSSTRCCFCKERCWIESVDELSIETMDDNPGPGRGLDRVFQSLGLRLERLMGVMLSRLGYGPIAVRRRALKAIADLEPEFCYKKEVLHGQMVVRYFTTSEVMRREKEIVKCCRMLAKYLGSAAPTTQLLALDALWDLRRANPLLVDRTYQELELSEFVDSIHDLLDSLKKRPTSDRVKMWKRKYVRPYDDDLLDSLLASSRKALFAVRDIRIHSAAKSLIQLRGGYGYLTHSRCSYAVPELQTLSGLILDPDLAFMAIAYIGKIGLRRGWGFFDDDLTNTIAAIVAQLFAICSSHMKRSFAEGEAHLDVYWRIRTYVNDIDVVRSLLPPKTQQAISTSIAATKYSTTSSAVDRQDLESAIFQAWSWLLYELVDVTFMNHRNFRKLRLQHAGGDCNQRHINQAWARLENLDLDSFRRFTYKLFAMEYQCTECADQSYCSYGYEAWLCFWQDGYDPNTIRKFGESKDSWCGYARTQIIEWSTRNEFNHERGECVRRLMDDHKGA